MPRIIDCINDRDSYWAHNGKTVFNFCDELDGYGMCLAALERGFQHEEKSDGLTMGSRGAS